MANRLTVPNTFPNGSYPTSSSLNSLISNVNNGLSLIAGAIVDMGGDDRVVDDATRSTELEVTASSPASMNVNVGTGFACVSETLCQNETISVKPVSTPVTNNRYTIIQISNIGAITTKNGTEAASPSEPSADTDCIKLAAIYLPKNCTEINDTDLGQGYIIDRRDIFAYHTTSIPRNVSFYLFGQLGTSGGPNDDGYYVGTSAGVGFTFGAAVSVEKVCFSFQDVPTGANFEVEVHNLDTAASVTATSSAGEPCEEDDSMSLAFGVSDNLALQVTQVGSSNAGGYVNIVLQYLLQS